METYVIFRRNAWQNPAELEEAAGRSREVGGEMADDINWIRSYIIDEDDGTLGSVCIYQGTSPDAVREHAKRAGMPAHEVIPVAETVLVGPDPL
jgi:Protein of unknown function (DUF4242)